MNQKIDAVWVLSGKEHQVRGENKKRIDKGLKIADKFGARYFIYNGVKLQNKYLRSYLKTKFLKAKPLIFDCSRKFYSNTEQQFKTLAKNNQVKHLSSLILVSDLSHLLRLRLYARKYLIGYKLSYQGTRPRHIRDFGSELIKIWRYGLIS